MKIYVLLSLLLSGCLAHGKPYDHNDHHELMNFHAGIYKLTQGSQERCGQGEFGIFQETKYLMLDALHGFSIKNSVSSEKSDIPEEMAKGCKYIGKNDVKINDNKTELTLTSVFKCQDVVRYTLVKRANITNRKINMQVKQVGEGAHEFNCEWERQN